MLWQKIQKKLLRLRLQPIRVFCFHHVSDEYNPMTMWECDWIQTNELKERIDNLRRQGCVFTSLIDAHERMKRDNFRVKKYVVLTADDGFKSLLNIIPWLIGQEIPITLFVNPKYILEDSMGDNTKHRLEIMKAKATSEEIYLKPNDINILKSPYITFAYHGYEHLDEKKMDENAFVQNLKSCIDVMQTNFPNVIPYYAHTFGRTSQGNDSRLLRQGITPVYVSGNMNYNNVHYIDRELLMSGDRN